MAIVYQHRRKDNGEVFYVGIGKSAKRAYEKRHRNLHWHNIVKKYGYYVEITHNNLLFEEACVIEQYLIHFWGRKDLNLGNLINLTDGGEGSFGREAWNKGVAQSIETKVKISNKLIGKSTKEETKKKISCALLGKVSKNKGKNISNKTKIAIRNSLLGKSQPKDKCPHCNKIGSVSLMKRWHFDNCKSR